jgi:hypothetical protein
MLCYREYRKRQARLTNAMEAAKKYKKALEEERRGSLQVEEPSRPGLLQRLFSRISSKFGKKGKKKTGVSAAQR